MLFHRNFPDKFIKVWRLRQVYKQNGVKLKKVLNQKKPSGAEDGRYQPLEAEMKRQVLQALADKKKIVWLDETVFTKTTNLTH